MAGHDGNGGEEYQCHSLAFGSRIKVFSPLRYRGIEPAKLKSTKMRCATGFVVAAVATTGFGLLWYCLLIYNQKYTSFRFDHRYRNDEPVDLWVNKVK
jgi:hypothetical protein